MTLSAVSPSMLHELLMCAMLVMTPHFAVQEPVS